MTERYDGDDRDSRTAFRAYDSLSEPVSTRTPWQIWRDACAWQAARAAPASILPRIRDLASIGVSYGLLADDQCSQIVALIDGSAMNATPADHIGDAAEKVDAGSVPVAEMPLTSGAGPQKLAWFKHPDSFAPGTKLYAQSPQPDAQSVRDAWISEVKNDRD